MKENELVSVIIPAYNCGDYISQCIDSLINQSYKNVEILVVYRESSDDTYKALKKYEGAINIIPQEMGLGPANARNIGILKSKGKYLCFCDADDCIQVEKIKIQVEYFLKSEIKEGLTYTDFLLIDKNNKMLEKIVVPDWNYNKWIKSGGFIGFSTVMVEKKFVVNAGMFDEKLESNEDFDLLIKLNNYTKFTKIPGFFSYRRIHSNNLSKNIIKTLFQRSRIYNKYGYFKLSITSFVSGLILSPVFYYAVDHPKIWKIWKSIRVLLNKQLA
jgi:glycosyltransferase involved in cell wall biosynthesis